MKLSLVSANGTSAFMAELLEVLAAELRAIGADVSTHTGPYPADDESRIYVVIPHEYFVLTPRFQHPSKAQLSRTIGFCVEHPGNATFDTTVKWAHQLGGIVDINRDSTEELNRRGIPAQRFVLGYSRWWDRWHGANTLRPIDITYLGTTDARRNHLLAIQAEQLSNWRTELLIPPHEMMTKTRPDFLMGEAKFEHLKRCNILLNLHRGASRALEWVRVLEAMCNGCVVVSEHSADFEPLLPGRDIAFARPMNAAAVASALLRHPERLEEMRQSAYATCKEQLSMQDSATRLAEIGEALLHGRRQSTRPLNKAQVVRRAASLPEPPPPATGRPALSAWTEALPEEARLNLANFVEETYQRYEPATEEYRFGNAPMTAVVITTPDERVATARTLDNLKQLSTPVVALVVNQTEALRNTGIPRGEFRNRIIAQIDTETVALLDGGQELFPNALDKLLRALQENERAAAVYGMMADITRGFLWNCLPPEIERMQSRVYIHAPLVIRRDAWQKVGGFSTEASLAGFEDQHFVAELLRIGETVIMLPEIVGRGSPSTPPLLGIPSLLPEAAQMALAPVA